MTTVTAWNIRQGGGDRASRIVRSLVELDTDVAILSEWRATSPNDLISHLRNAGYVHCLEQPDPDGGYAAVLVASRVAISPGGNSYDDHGDGHRFVEFRITDTDHLIAGVLIPGHEPANDRKHVGSGEYLVEEWAPTVSGSPALLCGDFNTGLHYRDELGATFECAEQLAALYDAGWRDAWLERNRQSRPPATWFSPGYDNPFRLDHALLSPASKRARAVDYPSSIGGHQVLGTDGLSDHVPVVITL
jgi:exodeoxyribonuclease III